MTRNVHGGAGQQPSRKHTENSRPKVPSSEIDGPTRVQGLEVEIANLATRLYDLHKTALSEFRRNVYVGG